MPPQMKFSIPSLDFKLSIYTYFFFNQKNKQTIFLEINECARKYFQASNSHFSLLKLRQVLFYLLTYRAKRIKKITKKFHEIISKISIKLVASPCFVKKSRRCVNFFFAPKISKMFFSEKIISSA